LVIGNEELGRFIEHLRNALSEGSCGRLLPFASLSTGLSEREKRNWLLGMRNLFVLNRHSAQPLRLCPQDSVSVKKIVAPLPEVSCERERMSPTPFFTHIEIQYLSTMKSLLVIRHAKSEQGLLLNDFDRPLNDRGKRDAPTMAKRIIAFGAKPQLIVSSPAKRAKKTAEYFFKELKLPENSFILKSELYHAPPQVFFDVIAGLDDFADEVALFSHNPGITYFVNMLTEARLDNMPTCAVFAVKANITRWKDFEKAEKEFLFFEYPAK
jgi:phosphohistidine phosphatase